MKTKKRIVSLILVLALTLGAIPAYAAEPEVQDFVDVEKASLSFDSAAAEKKGLPVTMDYNNLIDAKRLEFPAEPYSSRAASPAQVASVTASIETDSQSTSYSVVVPAGAIIQAELQVPENLSTDFDVVLYRCDMEENVAYPVSQSIYTTNGLFMAETVAAFNQTDAECPFLILIQDAGSHTAEDYFTLTVSIGGDPRQDEPNDNALTAGRLWEFTDYKEFILTSSFHTSIDHDWFVMNVEDATEYYGAAIEFGVDTTENIVVDSYTFDETTFTLRKVDSTKDGDILSLEEGDNYFHVYYDRSKGFVPGEYSITFSSRLKAAYARVVLATNGYCSRPSTQFADGQTRYMLVETDPVQIRVFYYAADGTPVKVNDTIHVEIHNPSWDADSLRYARGSDSFEGKSSHTVTLDRPGYVRGFEVRYNMVGVTVTSARLGTIMSHASYALIDRYNDDYLSKPCIHNRACGFR